MNSSEAPRIRVIDSHTAGEPTRIIISGVDEPAGETMAEKRADFAGQFDAIRRAVVCEPRAHEAMVGVMLCQPCALDCEAGLIFFNNVGVLNGCLHATMGAAVTLYHMGRISLGSHRFDTPSGVVTVELEGGGKVRVKNVRSYRHASEVTLQVPEYGTVTGDVAWGGNWFFLTEVLEGMSLDLGNIDQLADFSWKVRLELEAQNITGLDGSEIDHIELMGPPANDAADGKNFVLCPGKAYDRSPCGTGTSAKLACLQAEGKLAQGEFWRQAGILDTVFIGEIQEAAEGGVFPIVKGQAFITGEANLIMDPSDPFAFGISSVSTS